MCLIGKQVAGDWEGQTCRQYRLLGFFGQCGDPAVEAQGA